VVVIPVRMRVVMGVRLFRLGSVRKARQQQILQIGQLAMEEVSAFCHFQQLMGTRQAVGPFVNQLRRDHFVGVDNIAAGRTAGSLMGRFIGGRKGEIAVIAGSMLVGDHRDRLAGFSERLGEINPALDILPVMESHDDPARVHDLLRERLRETPNLAGVYNLGAGNRGLVKALVEHEGNVRPVVIAHELTPLTRDALRDDLIDAILNQDAGHEVRSAIRVLKAKADGMPVIAAQERIRIDIFLKDNLP